MYAVFIRVMNCLEVLTGYGAMGPHFVTSPDFQAVCLEDILLGRHILVTFIYEVPFLLPDVS